MTGIYKITNKINNKIYIGQAIDIKKRFADHIKPSSNKTKIDQAIKQYGTDNFIFEVIEECSIAELNEKEAYWIQNCNSLIPNGYNVVNRSNQYYTIYRTIDYTTLLKIIADLKNTTLSEIEIAKKYNTNNSTISRINTGAIYVLDTETYPIRKLTSQQLKAQSKQNKQKKEKIISMPPIDRKTLKELIYSISFVDIGKQFNVSDNAIRKWCDKYNLPRTKKEIKKYSMDEWKKI